MAQGRQAKILTPRQETAILRYLETTRYPARDAVMFLLSMKAGLRAKEIAAVTWAMVTDADGAVGDAIALENRASKGRSGRHIPMHPLLRSALVDLHAAARRKGASRARRGLLRARPGDVGRHGAAVVSSPLQHAQHDGVFVALGPPHLYHAGGAEGVGGGRQRQRRATTGRAQQHADDAALH